MQCHRIRHAKRPYLHSHEKIANRFGATEEHYATEIIMITGQGADTTLIDDFLKKNTKEPCRCVIKRNSSHIPTMRKQEREVER